MKSLSTKGIVLCALRQANRALCNQRVREALEATHSVGGAAIALGIDRRTLERWLHEDPTPRQNVPLPGPGTPKTAPADR